MHKILERQIRKHLGEMELKNSLEDTGISPEYAELLAAVSQTYDDFDKDRERAERSLEISSTELNQKNESLKLLDKQKDEFISIAAHELKTPLTSIKGFAQLLKHREIIDDREKAMHYLDLIDRNTDRLYSLILDIVDSSRITLGMLKISTEPVDIYKTFEEIRQNMDIIIKEKGLTPEFIIDQGLPMVLVDQTRLLQVLRNLLINAVKFTDHGTVSLKVSRKDEDFMLFEVRDTGMGIPDGSKQFIFSRFYQVDSSMTRKIQGSGLGLSVCKGLVDKMGGQIGFESEEGKGTLFHFTVPCAK